jgi:tetratricopeptide (TPR) repeat protein
MENLFEAMRSAHLLGKGEEQARQGKYERALEYYKEALKYTHSEEDSTVLFCCMANALARLGRNVEAREYAQRSLKLCEELEHLGTSIQEVRRKVEEVLSYVAEKS